MPRLFSGIELPDDIKDQLSDLEVPLPGASWIEEDNLHITLRFAGDIDNRLAHEFTEELSRIDIDVFELALEGVHVLGGNDPKILYAGLKASSQLDALARAHERAARSIGLPPEPRPFKPHITLARLRNVDIPHLTRFLQAHALLRSRPFLIEEFVLFSSRPKTGGGPYAIEEAFPLRGARHVFADLDE
ncbi:MAG: RNA 2',3'-cyclic phosphodiesterase [Hyphomicrobium sp.]|nr:RNA 2',3'-cyclic phosphodiesterase [Hyphomicrobium sp.]